MILGTLLSILSAAMIIPALVDYYYRSENYSSFIVSSFITAFFGFSLIIANRSFNEGEKQNITIKSAFLLTTLTWLVMMLFASIPFHLSNVGKGYIDAFFEATSGITTTGATIVTDLEAQSRGILIWRAILQWLGGIGIIVMAMSILPMLKIGGMQLFRTESSDKTDKVLPKAAQYAASITSIYVFLTVVIAIFMWGYADIGWFDAICHAMTSVASGGFSNYDSSIAYFENYRLEIVIVVAMIISGIPFVLLLQFVSGKGQALFKDTQVRFFIGLVVFSVSVMTFWLVSTKDLTFVEAFRMAGFNVTSIVTTTGYATSDYYAWGSFAVIFFYMLSISGGCTGSTSGSVKCFRYIILYENSKAQIFKLIHPHGVFRPKFNGKPISDETTASVTSFIVFFGICFCVVAMLLSMTGLDYTTSLSGAASTLTNVGPGLGKVIGPAGNYSSLTDFAKSVCIFAMLIGRLELFTVLILFTKFYWKS